MLANLSFSITLTTVCHWRDAKSRSRTSKIKMIDCVYRKLVSNFRLVIVVRIEKVIYTGVDLVLKVLYVDVC